LSESRVTGSPKKSYFLLLSPLFSLFLHIISRNYLRKLNLKKSLKKILRSPKLLLIAATVLVLSATLLFANKGIWRHVSLRRDVSVLSERDMGLSAEESLLIKKVDQLSTEDGSLIERIAREKYHMKRLGEVIYREEQPK
jgi:cell division protein FtsB